MVALLHPAQIHSAPAPRSARRPAALPAQTRPGAARPRHLRLVQTETKTAADPLSIVAVIAVMATLLLVVLVRGVQGAPPADDWQGLTEAAAPRASAGSVSASAVSVSAVAATVTVVEGDTWATIAARVEPGADPVAFARSLASVNGGYQLQVGQVLVVPTAG